MFLFKNIQGKKIEKIFLLFYLMSLSIGCSKSTHVNININTSTKTSLPSTSYPPIISSPSSSLSNSTPIFPHHSSVSTITEYEFANFDNPNPYRLYTVAAYRFVHNIGEFLVRRDAHQNIIGGLAHSWTISKDKTTITFYLRKGIYNSNEVAESLIRHLRYGQTAHFNLSLHTKKEFIRIIDDYTLEIQTFSDASALLNPLVMADNVILPDSHWVAKEKVNWSKIRGPYIWIKGKFPLKTNDEIVLKPNPKHYLYNSKQPIWKIIKKDLINYDNLNKIIYNKNCNHKNINDKKNNKKISLNTNNPIFFTLPFIESFKILRNSKLNNNSNIKYFETKPNGIYFLVLNQKGLFKEKKARKFLFKKILSLKKTDLIKSENRALQILQPGMTGRLTEKEIEKIINNIKETKNYNFPKPITWLIPKKDIYEHQWFENFIKSTNLQYKIIKNNISLSHEKWLNGEWDVTFLSLGMSDTDPISGASFMFSPKGFNIDTENHKILKILNSARNTSNIQTISNTVKKAFKIALEEALVIPLYYLVNRHYHTSNIELNISDPYNESIQMINVRIEKQKSFKR